MQQRPPTSLKLLHTTGRALLKFWAGAIADAPLRFRRSLNPSVFAAT
jgi:hypothetical protein